MSNNAFEYSQVVKMLSIRLIDIKKKQAITLAFTFLSRVHDKIQFLSKVSAWLNSIILHLF